MECTISSCSKSIYLSKPSYNATSSRKAPRIPLAIISLSSLDAQHLVRSASALAPAGLCSVLCSIIRIAGLLEGGILSYSSGCLVLRANRWYSLVCALSGPVTHHLPDVPGTLNSLGQWFSCFTVPENLLGIVLERQIPGSYP